MWESQGSWAGQLQPVENTDFTTRLPTEQGFLQEPTLKQRADILTDTAHGQSAPRSYPVLLLPMPWRDSVTTAKD